MHVECTSICDALWIGPRVNHDLRLNYHDSPSYNIAWTLNLERILNMYSSKISFVEKLLEMAFLFSCPHGIDPNTTRL